MISALNVDKLRLDLGEYILSVQAVDTRSGGRVVLAGVDLDVKRGASVALIGPAQAGKSLTLACIAGAARPSRGRIRYFGYEIRGRSQPRVVAMGIVRTHQIPQSFGDMTALEIVTAGALLRRGRLARARAYALDILMLLELRDRGSQTCATLGRLERKRLELARVLATDPQLLLLDDLAAGLDAVSLEALRLSVSRVRERNITILTAARTVDRCPLAVDEVIAIDGGRTIGAEHALIDFRL